VPTLASTSVPFGPTTVQTPNLALIETKWIIVQADAVQLFEKTKEDSHPSRGKEQCESLQLLICHAVDECCRLRLSSLCTGANSTVSTKKSQQRFEKYNDDPVEECTSPGSLATLLAVGAGEACAGPLVVRALLGHGVDPLATDAHRLRALHHLAVLVLLAHVHWAIWHGLTVRVDLCLRAEFFTFF
jgi:hypothetical protein